MRRTAIAAVAVLFVGGCYHGQAKPGPNDGSSLDFAITQTVVVDDTGIHPDVVQTRVGAAITVTNRGTGDHGLTSESIETGMLHPGESTTVYLTSTGTISVHDRVDPTHTGQIVVSAKS